MNSSATYTGFALAREMMETPGTIRSFRLQETGETAEKIKKSGKLFLTGEGSSRIFPAKNAMRWNLSRGFGLSISSEGSRQASEYNLDDYIVFGASNSGRTKEVIALFEHLRRKGHGNLFGLTANRGTVLESLCTRTFVLSCGKEEAVAATKSVVEQALFYQSLLFSLAGVNLDVGSLADAFDEALTLRLPEELV
ncbi:MAG: SIS domain-containing protein, partial [Spirochaetales bacterium]